MDASFKNLMRVALVRLANEQYIRGMAVMGVSPFVLMYIR